MKFGVREICNVVFKAKAAMSVGSYTFNPGQPVLYIDTATTSSLEGSSTTVYAQGGRGNARLIAWEGEKQITYTVEDALLSPIGFAILSGAGILGGNNDKANSREVHVHKSATAIVSKATDVTYIDLTDALQATDKICSTAPIFAVKAEKDGSVTGSLVTAEVTTEKIVAAGGIEIAAGKALKVTAGAAVGETVFVDFYVVRKEYEVAELQITADSFSGNFYVEADTLFRDQNSGKDMPAIITFPNVKIQSNFTFNMSASGDPSTFSFVMDAFPGYTTFDNSKKVICVIQVVNDIDAAQSTLKSVMAHTQDEIFEDTDSMYYKDSYPSATETDEKKKRP